MNTKKLGTVVMVIATFYIQFALGSVPEIDKGCRKIRDARKALIASGLSNQHPIVTKLDAVILALDPYVDANARHLLETHGKAEEKNWDIEIDSAIALLTIGRTQLNKSDEKESETVSEAIRRLSEIDLTNGGVSNRSKNIGYVLINEVSFEAIPVYISIDAGDAHYRDKAINALFPILISDDMRAQILALYPVTDGALVVTKTTGHAEFVRLLRKSNYHYSLEYGDVEKLYMRHR